MEDTRRWRGSLRLRGIIVCVDYYKISWIYHGQYRDCPAYSLPFSPPDCWADELGGSSTPHPGEAWRLREVVIHTLARGLGSREAGLESSVMTECLSCLLSAPGVWPWPSSACRNLACGLWWARSASRSGQGRGLRTRRTWRS